MPDDGYTAAAKRLLRGRGEARVLAAMGPQQPDRLLAALIAEARRSGVRLTLLFADLPGRFDFLDDACAGDVDAGRLELVTLAGAVPRRWSARTNHVPRSLWDVDRLIAAGSLNLDIVVARVTETGWGDMVGYTPSALATGTVAAFEVVPGPVRPGTPPLPLDRADVILRADAPPSPVASSRRDDAAANAIGRLTASLVPDGSTLQLGLGTVPEALIPYLADHTDLGVHSGILGPALLPLIAIGVITGARKSHDRRLHVATGLVGRAPAGHEWGSDVRLEPISRTHAPARLLSTERLWAINSALEVDLTGQPNAEYAGGVRIASGGGQADFVRAAHASPGGAAVLVLPSRTKQGRSRIVARLGEPGIPTSPGSDIDLVVTEYGIADLRGKTAAEISDAILGVAHPDDRRGLRADS